MNGSLILLSLCTIVTVKPAVYRPVSSLSKLLDIDSRILFSIIYIESGFHDNALSKKGAIGLMQIMPANLSWLGASKHSSLENIVAGTILLKRYLRMFSLNLFHALAAYNAGPVAVRRFGGVPPYSETRKYLWRFCQAFIMNRYVCGVEG